MRSFWLDFLTLWKRHPRAAAILGVFSIYIFWAIPALPPFLDWGESFSFAFVYGDYLVLPLFNAASFWLLAKNAVRIPKKAIFAPFAVAIVATLALEPDASAFLKTGSIESVLRAYHSGFIAVEMGLVFFMCAVYPFLRGTYAPLWTIGILVVLVEIFLGFVHIADAWMHSFTLVENISPATLLLLSYVVFVLHRKFGVFGKLKRAVLR